MTASFRCNYQNSVCYFIEIFQYEKKFPNELECEKVKPTEFLLLQKNDQGSDSGSFDSVKLRHRALKFPFSSGNVYLAGNTALCSPAYTNSHRQFGYHHWNKCNGNICSDIL